MSPSTQPLSRGVIGGIAAASAGVFILLLCIVVLIFRARRAHKRRIADLESRGAGISRGPSIAEIPSIGTHRTRTVLRKNTTFVPYGPNNSGWDSLHSNDSWQLDWRQNVPGQSHPPVQPLTVFPTIETNRTAGPRGGFSWIFGRRSGPKHNLTKAAPLSRLSAITEAFCESPRSQHPVALPIIPDPDQEDPSLPQQSASPEQPADSSGFSPKGVAVETHRASSPLLDIPAMPALRPVSALPQSGTDTIRLVQASRSKSIAYLPSSEYDSSATSKRPAMHKRSISLCTQKSGQMPAGPAPPLPAFLGKEQKRNTFLQISPSRISVSSVGSGGSSVLVQSPNTGLRREFSGKLMEGAHRHWRSSLISTGRPVPEHGTSFNSSPGPRRHHTVSSRCSHRSSFARWSGGGFDFKLSRANSVASTLASHNRQSYGESDDSETASQSPAPSRTTPSRQLHSPGSRRSSRFFVDSRGSPVARHRDPVMSGPAEASDGPQAPDTHPALRTPAFTFQPAPMQAGSKPSALKGSPNGRKGHRRQNCVRIQLAPTILGPSPPRMRKIQEEESPKSDGSEPPVHDNTFEFRSDPVRGPRTRSFTSNPRYSYSSQRNSLVASSSTTSLVHFFEDNGLPLDQLGLIPGLTISKRRQPSDMTQLPALPGDPLVSRSRDGATKRQLSVSMPHLNMSGATTGPLSHVEEDSEGELCRDGPDVQPDTQPSVTATPTTDDLMAEFLSLSSDDSKTLPGTDHPLTQKSPASSPPTRPSTEASRKLHQSARPISLPASPSQVSPKTIPTMYEFGGNLLVTEPVDVPASFSPVLDLPAMAQVKLPSANSLANMKSPSRAATIVGPRAQPAQPLGRAVRMLRRMNSDVGLDYRAERRYLGLVTGDASPTVLSGLYRDSYADFTPFGQPSAEAMAPSHGKEMESPLEPAVGLGILGSDLDDDPEIDIDVMLRSSRCGSEQRTDYDELDNLSWLDNDENDLWGREVSGALGLTGSLADLPLGTEFSSQDPQLVAGAEDDRGGSSWKSTEHTWSPGAQDKEQPDTPPDSSSTSAKPVGLIPTEGSASRSEMSGAIHIPGLSLTSASSPEVAGISKNPAVVAGAENGGVGARSSWGLIGLSGRKRKAPERANTMRKSAILNLSVSAHNRQRKTGKNGGNGSMSAADKTPEPSEKAKRGERGTPGSLYDEDGFLKT